MWYQRDYYSIDNAIVTYAWKPHDDHSDDQNGKQRVALLLSHVACFKETKNGTCDFENKGWTKIYGVCDWVKTESALTCFPVSWIGDKIASAVCCPLLIGAVNLIGSGDLGRSNRRSLTTVQIQQSIANVSTSSLTLLSRRPFSSCILRLFMLRCVSAARFFS